MHEAQLHSLQVRCGSDREIQHKPVTEKTDRLQYSPACSTSWLAHFPAWVLGAGCIGY
jgi:hypothetical protein